MNDEKIKLYFSYKRQVFQFKYRSQNVVGFNPQFTCKFFDAII